MRIALASRSAWIPVLLALSWTGPAHAQAPRVTPLDNGRVSVDMRGCSVLFDGRGNVLNSGRDCTSTQIRSARAAFDAHQREQGASDAGGAAPGRRTVVCESQDDRMHTCSVPIVDGRAVRLERQLSNAHCTENQTWGARRGQIWVTQGCRGRFSYPVEGGAADRATLTCESRNDRMQTCSVPGLDPRSVRLERQLSDAHCTENRTWGARRNEIWVTEGCRGRFSYLGGGGGGGGSARRNVSCESRNDRMQTCTVPGVNISSVRLERRLSDSPCVRERSWGVRRNEIWVTAGCRARFSYTVGGGRE